MAEEVARRRDGGKFGAKLNRRKGTMDKSFKKTLFVLLVRLFSS
jgi:hypothetical protein